MELGQVKHIKTIKKKIASELGIAIQNQSSLIGEDDENIQKIATIFVNEIKCRYRYQNISDSFFEDVCKASVLHDIGKIQIPESILKKPGKLTMKEFETVKRHTVSGALIFKKVTQNFKDKQFVRIAYNIIKHHHERYDGKGYPNGFKEEKIPLEARIMTIVDVYDALVSPRPYKAAISKEKAIQIIKDGQGTQFDPHLVNVFLDIVKEF